VIIYSSLHCFIFPHTLYIRVLFIIAFDIFQTCWAPTQGTIVPTFCIKFNKSQQLKHNEQPWLVSVFRFAG